MGLKPSEISRLTRAGYLQCPTWVLSAPADRFAEYRNQWYGTFAGNCSILTAAMKELIVTTCREIELRVMK